MNNPDVDIVDIAAPTYLHHDIAIEAAKAGKHVFCEKPIGLSQNQALEMYDAAERAGIVHYLNHNYRRCPAVALAKRIIDEGRLGQLFCFGAQLICKAGLWTRSFRSPGTCARKRQDPAQTRT